MVAASTDVGGGDARESVLALRGLIGGGAAIGLDNNLDDGDKVRGDAGDGALGGEYSVGGCWIASLGAGRSSGGDIEAGFAGGLILTGSGGAV